MSPTVSTLVEGFLLGWSIAWPPGPINAEMIRRGLTRGFWSAWSLGLGACSGDFVWALLVATGAGAVAARPAIRSVLAVLSIAFLVALGVLFLRSALRAWRAARSGADPEPPKALDSARAGWLLGFGMALTGPWNLAFWLAVLGQSKGAGAASPYLLAAAVLAGAMLWGFVLCTAVKLGARFATPSWVVVSQGATGALMLAFAVRGILRMAAS